MGTAYRPTARYKLTENYNPYLPKNPNFGYTGDQESSQNVASGLYFENIVGHIIVNKLVNKVIGKGLTPMSAPDVTYLGWTKEQGRKFSAQAESLYRLLCNDPSIDWSGKDTILQLQRKALRMIFISGDVLLHIGFHKRKGKVVPYIQLINGRLVSNPGSMADTKTMIGGVYFNEAGKETGYSILETGTNLEDTMSYRKVNKYNTKTGRMDFDLITIDLPEAGMVRGVPLLTPLRDDVLQTDKLKEVHLTKAIIQSLFSVAIEKDETEAPEEIPSFKERIAGSISADSNQVETMVADSEPVTLGSGQVVELEPGEKMKTVETAMQSDDFATTM
ncbi:MAG: phage portal protein, partial [Bullifex sp.]